MEWNGALPNCCLGRHDWLIDRDVSLLDVKSNVLHDDELAEDGIAVDLESDHVAVTLPIWRRFLNLTVEGRVCDSTVIERDQVSRNGIHALIVEVQIVFG